MKLTPQEELKLAAVCRKQWIDNVPVAFRDLTRRGSPLSIKAGEELRPKTFSSRFRYTSKAQNAGGVQNHFQGFQRLVSGQHIVVSGGDWRRRNQFSHVFVGRFASAEDPDDPAPPLAAKAGVEEPRDGDTLFRKIELDKTCWHAGGISICGTVLVVPVECGPTRTRLLGGRTPRCEEQSRVQFVDLNDPVRPRILDVHVDRPGEMATAASMIHVPGRGYLLVVLSATDEVPGFQNRKLEFRWSNTASLCDGFADAVNYQIPRSLAWRSYQAINLVRETQGRVFVFGVGQDDVDLFEIKLPVGNTEEEPIPTWDEWKVPPTETPWVPELRPVCGRSDFGHEDGHADFQAGAGVWAHENRLGLYSVPEWRLLSNRLLMTEWLGEDPG
ncbi:MAG: hypothetical protein MJB57_05660 [Gemmatimonadetes bacterium]|nr:hypothetical protein [Gemmatimonadota bacterium]